MVSPTPTWQAATPSSLGQSGQINQFLGAHAVQYLYQGTLQDNQLTAGSGGTTTNSTYIAQKFTTAVGQTTVGMVGIQLTNTGSLASTTLSIYASSAGAPTGVALVTATLTKEFVSFAPHVDIIPLPLTGLTASTVYFLVTSPAGTSGAACFTWGKSNQTSGTFTSTNGTSWTSQTYGSIYEVWDQTVVGPLVATWEDSGARWCWFNRNTNQSISQLSEYTVGQAGGYLQSDRAFTYSGMNLTSVA